MSLNWFFLCLSPSCLFKPPCRPLGVCHVSSLFPGSILEPTAWSPSPLRGSRALGTSLCPLEPASRAVTLPPWNSTFRPGSSESAEGNPAAFWQGLLLLNLFSQPVTDLYALQVSGPNASFNSLLLMEIWGLGSKPGFGIDFHQFNSSFVLTSAHGTWKTRSGLLQMNKECHYG